jgi:hypothetical protein
MPVAEGDKAIYVAFPQAACTIVRSSIAKLACNTADEESRETEQCYNVAGLERRESKQCIYFLDRDRKKDPNYHGYIVGLEDLQDWAETRSWCICSLVRAHPMMELPELPRISLEARVKVVM